MNQNPNCDGNHCHKSTGEVRLLPYGGKLPYGNSGNLILCYSCYLHEIAFRKERNKEVWEPFDLPSWESLTVYKTN